MRGMRAAQRLIGLLCLAGMGAGACAARPVKIRLNGLAFEGNQAISTSEIRGVLASQPSGRWPWSTPEPFDQQVFEQDLDRVRQLYQDRGYPDARVDQVHVDFNDARTAVKVRVVVDEGEPITIAHTTFEGFEPLEPAILSGLDRSAVEDGRVRDRAAVAAVRQRAAEQLHDHGYAYGTVALEETEAGPHQVALRVVATPGPATVFGPVTIVGTQRLDERVIRRQLSIIPGQPYRESRVSLSQRRLGSLDILRFATINARPPEDGQPTAIPVRVVVAEDKPRRLEIGLGYGTEDRARASVEWSHLNFLGDARRASLMGQWSSIDRGLRLSLAQPYFLRRGLSFEASASTWWTGERIYTSRTYGGRVGVNYRRGGRGRGTGRPPDSFRLAYDYEFLSYQVRPETLEDLTQVSQLIALGLDPVTGAGKGTKTAVVADYQHTATDTFADPHKGWALTLHGEVASPALGGTFRYRGMIGEVRGYLPVGRTVVAVKANAGSLVARTDTDVPFSSRFFLGGASSLRGWSRYEVAPLSDGVPIGGRTMAQVSLEWRVPVTGPIQVVGFGDSGNVWAGSLDATIGGFRSDVGVGLRYRTPVGLLRGDAAMQLNPIPGLLVDGEPETRHWRIHVSIGQSF
jgi:outer membrane protein insertion porin family